MYGAALRASKLRRFQPNRRNGPPVPRTAAANRRLFPKNRNSRIATVIHEAPGHTPACFRPTAGPGSAKGTTGPRPGARNGRQRARRDQAEKQGREHPAEGTEQERTKHKDETGSAKRQKTKRKTGMSLTDTAAVRPFMQTRRPDCTYPGKEEITEKIMILNATPRQCPALRIRRFSVRASDSPPPAAPFLAPPAHPLCESRCKRPKTALDVRTLRFTAIRKQPAQCTSEIRKAPTLPIVRPESRLPQRDSNSSRAAAEARRTPPHRTRFERSMTGFPSC